MTDEVYHRLGRALILEHDVTADQLDALVTLRRELLKSEPAPKLTEFPLRAGTPREGFYRWLYQAGRINENE
jgi:hypothetical protein